MGTYLISLIAAALVASLVGILTPEGERGGIARHMRLLIALVLLCTLIAPIKETITSLMDFAGGESPLPEIGDVGEEDYQKELEEAMSISSKTYLIQLLTQALEREFSITSGEVRCAVRWSDGGSEARPTLVTVILSGRAIWCDPTPIEQYVTSLFGCECVTAIE